MTVRRRALDRALPLEGALGQVGLVRHVVSLIVISGSAGHQANVGRCPSLDHGDRFHGKMEARAGSRAAGVGGAVDASEGAGGAAGDEVWSATSPSWNWFQ